MFDLVDRRDTADFTRLMIAGKRDAGMTNGDLEVFCCQAGEELRKWNTFLCIYIERELVLCKRIKNRK
jgi:hypothetical protein